MNPLSMVILQSGIVDQEILAEISKWRMPVDIPSDLPPPPKTLEELVSRLEEALESEGMVLVKETDLSALHEYLRTQTQGVLHVETDVHEADINISYGQTIDGRYLIPWRGESIQEEMTDRATFLRTAHGEVHFAQVSSLFYGDVQAFMVCTPYQEDKRMTEGQNDVSNAS